ncbi:hypothetical protein GCM10022393_26050 [Aquimarina addita]|uniref:Uncharacterized protein n=1 Tax=Aquimarina addita TaxID=870485 RepID=A0ABP6UNZ1_9FLAO
MEIIICFVVVTINKNAVAKKGREKNTLNKEKHTKLMNRKKNKLKKEKALRASRLKAIITKANDQKEKE